MSINSGTGIIRRRHAKNYIQNQADARLQEVITQYQQQGLNALGVDSFSVLYFRAGKSTQICTCKQVEATKFNMNAGSSPDLPPVLDRPKSIVDQTITIDYERPLFGFGGEQRTEKDAVETDEFAIEDDEAESRGIEMVDQILSSSAECGICYKQGFVPGYTLYGWERQVCATHNTADAYGYQVDQSKAPNKFQRVDKKEGFVEFAIDVPKYFVGCQFSIRNNTTILHDSVIYRPDGGMVTAAYLRADAGGPVRVRVTDDEFTHLVMLFNTGTEPVRANLAQGTRTLDWSQFDMFGTIQIILPMMIPDVVVADVVWVPSRGMAFKVTDLNYLRTASGQNIDWQVTVRVLQPTESLKLIHKAVVLA